MIWSSCQKRLVQYVQGKQLYALLHNKLFGANPRSSITEFKWPASKARCLFILTHKGLLLESLSKCLSPILETPSASQALEKIPQHASRSPCSLTPMTGFSQFTCEILCPLHHRHRLKTQGAPGKAGGLPAWFETAIFVPKGQHKESLFPQVAPFSL